MKHTLRWGLLLLAVTGTAWADKVVLKDGTVREGTVVGEDDAAVRLRISRDGIKSTIAIPKATIAQITKAPPESQPAPEAKPEPKPEVPAPAPAEPKTAPGQGPTATPKPRPPAGPFFEEMFLQAAGLRPDISDPANLPPDAGEIWVRVVQAQEAKPEERKPEVLLAALTDLLAALEDKPGRLDAVAMRYLNKPFARWLAETRWEVITVPPRFKGGNFDLKEVSDYERTELIGVMRSHTRAAIEPLRVYFPKIEPPVKPGSVKPVKPGQQPVKVDPLAAITTGNAIQVRDQVVFAVALLQAQQKLEPEMSADDKAAIAQYMQWIMPIRQRALPLAVKADQERRLAEERARRGSRP